MKRAFGHSTTVHCGAFTIIEMLIAVILLTAVSGLLTQLFVISFKAQRDSQKYEELLHRVDSALLMLRRDTWSARSVQLDGQRLEMSLPTGGSAVWRQLPDGTLTRTAEEKTQSWRGLPPLAFSANGALLSVAFHTAPGRDESLTLISQQLAAGGGQ